MHPLKLLVTVCHPFLAYMQPLITQFSAAFCRCPPLLVFSLLEGEFIYHGLCNLFFGVLHGMLFYCFISSRLYIFELFSFIFIRILQLSLQYALKIKYPMTRGCHFLLDVVFCMLLYERFSTFCMFTESLLYKHSLDH